MEIWIIKTISGKCRYLLKFYPDYETLQYICFHPKNYKNKCEKENCPLKEV